MLQPDYKGLAFSELYWFGGNLCSIYSTQIKCTGFILYCVHVLFAYCIVLCACIVCILYCIECMYCLHVLFACIVCMYCLHIVLYCVQTKYMCVHICIQFRLESLLWGKIGQNIATGALSNCNNHYLRPIVMITT